MKNLHSPSPVSTLQVLDVLSDRTSVDIMNAIAENVTTSDNIIELLGLTTRQYYIRHSMLLKTGIIKRKKRQIDSYFFWTTDIPGVTKNRYSLQTSP